MPAFNRPAIEELFDYTGFSWDGVLDATSECGVEYFTKPAPGSGWPSLRDVLGHVLFGYDRWLAIMKGEPMRGFDPAGVQTLEELNEAYTSFRDEFRALLEVPDDDLFRVEDTMVDGEPIKYSRGELMAHLLLHERGHFGDITTLFYQLGVEPDMGLEYRFMLDRHPD